MLPLVTREYSHCDNSVGNISKETNFQKLKRKFPKKKKKEEMLGFVVSR